MNYRLGAFGWLSGPTFQSDGTANAGLHDQRFALEWIKQHISKFGGDPSRVTVFGESAGGGSIMHQITAYGGKKGVCFQQAVPQSPGFLPYVSNQQQEQTLNGFLGLLNVKTIEEARQQPFSALVRANAIQVGASPYGQFTYGPTVDGDFVPALPGVLMLHGEYAKDLKVMVGHNADEVSAPFCLSVLEPAACLSVYDSSILDNLAEKQPSVCSVNVGSFRKINYNIGTAFHLALHSEQHGL